MFAIASVALASSFLAYAGEPPTEPILRIDPGDHTGVSRSVATDRAGRWLVTASQDKTSRVWDAHDGHLVSTLRTPIGSGIDGQLDAVALSPDGQTVALGGFTQFNSGSDRLASDGMNIYLFDRATGRLLRRVTGISANIIDLAFSSDGRILAATLARHGLRLFSVTDGSRIAEDDDYRAASYSVDFGPGGQLVTTSFDGLLRLYSFDGGHLTLIAKSPAPGGKEPGAARFSPDGSRIAVGFLDTTAVDVLNGRDLSFIYAPSTAGIVKGTLAGLVGIAWSGDGAYLYAAGDAKKNFNGQERQYIRRWGRGGAGAAQDWPVTDGAITRLVAMPGGRLAFTSGDASWGVVDANGSRQIFHAPAMASSRYIGSGFELSPDGTKVRFCYEVNGKSPAVFDSVTSSFLPAVTGGLVPPQTTAPGLNVEGWNGTSYSAPTFNGAQLVLKPNEMSNSLSMFPGGDGFVLGTGFFLRAFDRNGRELWEQPAPSGVFAVNVSQDSRWVVAAYGDGTIRWHRLKDGVEQLAFFPDPDKRRWVMWTPSGYYHASAGGEDLIGWHVNHGADQAADFYPVSQFRDRFNRPDVITQVLDTQNEATAVARANAAADRHEATVSVEKILPPVIVVVSAPRQFADTTVSIRILLKTPTNAPVTRLRILVNGEIMPSPRAAEPVDADGSRELTLLLPPKDSEVKIYADNRNSTSLPVTLALQWVGSRKVFVAGEQGTRGDQKPKLWVLAVGVSDYNDPSVPRLSYASADAQAFADILRAQQGKAYREVEIKVLTDSEATRANVLSGLDWLKSRVTAGDVGIVFLAGHGFTMATDRRYYYGSVDVNLKKLIDTGVPYSAIQDALIDFNLRGDGTRAVFFIDTCHAGDATSASPDTAVKASNGDALAGELTRTENQVLVFASSKGDQSSWEEPQFRHGAFTEALIEGLGTQWQADPRATGRVTYKNLDAWISDRVPVITQGKQTPRLMAPPGGVDDFVLGTR
jgi:WD40 repeat protein